MKWTSSMAGWMTSGRRCSGWRYSVLTSDSCEIVTLCLFTLPNRFLPGCWGKPVLLNGLTPLQVYCKLHALPFLKDTQNAPLKQGGSTILRQAAPAHLSFPVQAPLAGERITLVA